MTTNVVEQWSKKEINVNNFPKNLVACYMMTKGNIEDKNEIKGLEQERATWKEWVQTAKGGVVKEKEKRQGNNTEKDEETDAEEQEENTTTPTTPTEQTTNVTDGDDNSEGKTSNEGNDDFQEVTTQFEQLSTFALWFISFNADLQKKEELENKIQAIKERLENFDKTNKDTNEETLKYKTQLENLIPHYEE